MIPLVGDQFLSMEVLRHGAYLCLRPRESTGTAALAAAPIPALAERLGLRSEYAFAGPPPEASIAFLRRVNSVPREMADPDLLRAEWVIHVAAKDADPVMSFCVHARTLLEPHAGVRILSGVVRPRNCTGAAMERWAYARAVVQQGGAAMPNAFLLPMSKMAPWWRKDWMERHTYFLPIYDAEGRLVAEGHALAHVSLFVP
jgi:hypothetical protein